MAILIDEGRRLGLAGIELTTMQDNAAAFALYEKVGFKYLRDVENQVGDGRITIERCMFLPLQDGAEPMTEAHAPPM
jgi:ribosomal protein S18 acetylase RimI-like enzyme